jgi:hypothetical protein
MLQGCAEPSSSQPVILSRARAGDRVAGIVISDSSPFLDGRTSFAGTITVNDQIQQSSATDLSGAVIMVILLAGS